MYRDPWYMDLINLFGIVGAPILLVVGVLVGTGVITLNL
ncbi:hypothetical protein NOGI109294_21705 [Nocardiopsis gilva]